MKKAICITVLHFLLLQFCFAQNMIRGTVTDEGHQPLQGVTVSAGKNLPVAVSDSLGNYSFSVSSANIIITFSHIGYEPLKRNASGNHVIDVILVRNDQFLSETVVNSFERGSTIKNLPAAVYVLKSAELERYNNESLVSAVSTVPGVKMDERSPGSYRLSIRGNLLRSTFGVRNVKIYWNGIPFTDANGNTYLNEIAFSNVGKIEILKGPSGSMYGSGTGGVVLLRSNLSSAKEKNITLQSGIGSYGLFYANACYNQSGNNSVSSLSFSHQQSDGYRRQTNMRRDIAGFSGTFILNERQHISANIFYSDLFYQTPGGLTFAEMQQNPRQARPAAGAFNSAEAQKAAIYLKTMYAGFAHEYHFNSSLSNTTAVYFSNTNFRNPAIRNYERKTEQGIGARTVTKYKAGFFTGVLGAEYQYGFTNTSTFANKLGEIDTLQIHDEIDSRQFNIFLQADINLPAGFLLNAGMSYNNFHYGFVRLNQLPAVKQSSDFSPQLVPRISVLKKIIDKFSVYASVSKGYSPPSIDEVHAGDGNFNNKLNAETAMNYEIGVKGDIIKQKLSVDVCYYIYGLNNTIVGRKDAGGADYFINAGKTRQRGLEASAIYAVISNSKGFIRQLDFRINYTNIYARFRDYTQGTSKYDGNKLTGTSPDVFIAGLDVNTGKGIYLNLTYNYTGKTALNDANSFFADAYNLFFARAGYKIKIGSSVTADLFMAYNRSFNDPYSLGNDLNAAGNRYYNPAAPEQFTGGFKLKFMLP